MLSPRELRKVVNAPGAPAGEKVYIRDTLQGIDRPLPAGAAAVVTYGVPSIETTRWVGIPATGGNGSRPPPRI